jgi:hypothetical protein
LANRLSACSNNHKLAGTFDQQKSHLRDGEISYSYRCDKDFRVGGAWVIAGNFRQIRRAAFSELSA